MLFKLFLKIHSPDSRHAVQLQPIFLGGEISISQKAVLNPECCLLYVLKKFYAYCNVNTVKSEHCCHCFYAFTPYVISLLSILWKVLCILINNKLFFGLFLGHFKMFLFGLDKAGILLHLFIYEPGCDSCSYSGKYLSLCGTSNTNTHKIIVFQFTNT